jgi:hypothetical protein
MSRIPFLPKWVLPSVSSIYDLESATISEMVPKLYGTMRELVNNYNDFAEELNEEIQNFTGSSSEEIANFKNTIEERLRCKFEDLDQHLHKILLDMKQYTDTTLERAFSAFGVTVKESGEDLLLVDATNEKIRGLSIYGKTTQRWDPVPEYPADLQSVGDSGSVTVEIRNGSGELQQLTIATPEGLPGIPVSEGGNYTDATGQQWICDEIDIKRGVYVQRIKKMILPDNFSINNESNELWINLPDTEKCVTKMTEKLCICSHFPGKTRQETYNSGKTENFAGVSVNGSVIRLVYNAKFNGDAAGFNAWIRERSAAGDPVIVSYILETPTERPLTAAELATYKQLHTYMPDTTVTTNANAGIRLEYVTITQLYLENKIHDIAVETTREMINEAIRNGEIVVGLEYNEETEEANIIVGGAE